MKNKEEVSLENWEEEFIKEFTNETSDYLEVGDDEIYWNEGEFKSDVDPKIVLKWVKTLLKQQKEQLERVWKEKIENSMKLIDKIYDLRMHIGTYERAFELSEDEEKALTSMKEQLKRLEQEFKQKYNLQD